MPTAQPINATGGATYDTIVPPPEPETQGEGSVGVGIAGETADDSVEIAPQQPPPPGNYGPTPFRDRFRFDLQNGMRSPGPPFSALSARSRGFATAGYDQRENVAVQITRSAGGDSSYAALFNLQYREADPESGEVTRSTEAKTELNRMADRNLRLLHQL